jgi:hypothetical protein
MAAISGGSGIEIIDASRVPTNGQEIGIPVASARDLHSRT